MVKDNPIQLTACVIVRNEEKLIERCLQSIYNVVDEIIVIHDGPCTDQTLVIASKYRVKIIEAVFRGFMEAHLPLACQQAKGEWLLRIDADEFLSSDLQKKIRKLIAIKDVNAYEFIWPIFDGNKYQTKHWPYKRCLFRRLSMSFLAIPHYDAKVKGRVIQSNLVLDHKPIIGNYSWFSFKNKMKRWSKFQANLYLQNFSTISSFNYIDKFWPRNIDLRRKLPLLLLPLDFLLVFLRIIFSKALLEGLYIWQVALYQGLYRASVDWNIFILKSKK